MFHVKQRLATTRKGVSRETMGRKKPHRRPVGRSGAEKWLGLFQSKRKKSVRELEINAQ